MAYTQEQLDAIKDAYARGVIEATLPDGSRVRYQSIEDMERIIAKIETDLGLRGMQTNVSYPTYRRGYD